MYYRRGICFGTLWRVLCSFLGFVRHLCQGIHCFLKLCCACISTLLQTAAIVLLFYTSCHHLIGRGRSSGPRPLSVRRRYFWDVNIYDCDLLCIAFLSFISRASFTQSVIHGIIAENIPIGGRGLCWTEMSLQSSAGNVSLALQPLLRPLQFRPYFVVKSRCYAKG